MIKKLATLLAGAALMMAAGSAWATPVLDFNVVAPTAGKISYAGNAAPLVGAGINVDNIVGMDTLLNNNLAFDILNGVLNFTTGNVISSTTTTAVFGGGANAEITLYGTVDVNGNKIADAGDITGLLLIGTFGNVQVITTNGQTRVAGAGFRDFKNPELLALYGISALLPSGEPLPFEGAFNLSFMATDSNLSDGFESTRILSGDVTNTPVPEPGTMVLFGAGLLGLAIFGKRRMNQV